MKLFVFLLVTLCATLAAGNSRVADLTARVAATGDASKAWAVLVAGSEGWGNYRHQADVCHAFQALRKLGVPEAQIIVMMYDDIAYHRSNPFPGKVFNFPGHREDVYTGVPHDYTGKDVNVEVFHKVMTGEDPGVGSRKTLRSGPTDSVFFYYDDHGNVGIVAFPSGNLLTDTRFEQIIQTMTQRKMYGELVLYVQACMSGSMFYKQTLPKNVYGVSSAPVDASAFAFNYDSDLGTYVASRWAYAWIYATETQGSAATFQDQFQSTWNFVKNWSQPCQYGDLRVTQRRVHEFFGGQKDLLVPPTTKPFEPVDNDDSIPQWEVPLDLARRDYARFNSREALATFKQELAVKQRIDDVTSRIIAAAVPNAPYLQTVPCEPCSQSCECMQNCDLYSRTACEFVCCNERSCFERAPSFKDPQVSALACTETLVKEFQSKCGADGHPYVTSATPLLHRLCKDSRVDIHAAIRAINTLC